MYHVLKDPAKYSNLSIFATTLSCERLSPKAKAVGAQALYTKNQETPMISKLMYLAFILGGVSCGKSDSKNTPAAAGLSAGFGTNCSSCHGSAATGGSAKSLKSYAGSQDAFTSAIRNGASGMPQTFTTSQYSDADLVADYNFLKSAP